MLKEVNVVVNAKVGVVLVDDCMERMIQIQNISDIENYLGDLRAVILDLDDILYPLDEYVKNGFHQISRLFLRRMRR